MIGIDVGRASVKVAGDSDRNFAFPSVVGEARDLRLGDDGDYRVSIDGQSYFVGALAEESFARREMATESKVTPETAVLFLTALALAGGGDVATGLPVSHHSPDGKAALERLLWGAHRVTVNGATSVVKVERLTIVPEGAASFWGMVLNDEGRIVRPGLTGKRVRVLDLGSRTVNYVTLIGGKYLDRESGTLGYGCLELDHVADAQLTRRIIGDLAKHLADLRPSDDFLLTGGGALRLGSYFRRDYPNSETVNDPVYANAIGYRKLGVIHASRAVGVVRG